MRLGIHAGPSSPISTSRALGFFFFFLATAKDEEDSDGDGALMEGAVKDEGESGTGIVGVIKLGDDIPMGEEEVEEGDWIGSGGGASDTLAAIVMSRSCSCRRILDTLER